MNLLVAILAVACAVIVFKRLRVIIAQQAHLHDEDLEDYLEGRLVPGSSAHKQVVAHLGICEKCRNRLRQLEERGSGETS